MGAYLATPPLPWANNVGGSIILKDKYVTLQDIIDGAVVFQVKDNHDEVNNATIVQYPSDQKYYLQVDGTNLWQLGDISQAVNRINLIATGNIPQGFSLVGVLQIIGYKAEIYANEACTERPVRGQNYQTLWVRTSIDIGFNGEQTIYNGSSEISFYTPTTEIPDDPYRIQYCVDWDSGGLSNLPAGIYQLQAAEALEFDFEVNFGPIYS